MVSVGYMLCLGNKKQRVIVDSHHWRLESGLLICTFCYEKIEIIQEEGKIEATTDIKTIIFCKEKEPKIKKVPYRIRRKLE